MKNIRNVWNVMFSDKKNRYFYLAVLLIVFIGILLRLLRFDALTSFQHDNSRDLLLTYKMLHYGEWIYRGPTFSVIWGYLSPLYYYILIPFHLLFNYHPVSAAVLTSIAGIVSSVVAFLFLKRSISRTSALIVLFLYSLSFYYLRHSLDGLNPTLVPPLAVLSLFSAYEIFIKRKEKFLILFSVSFAFLVSLHPSGVFVIFPFLVFLLIYRIRFSIKTLLWSSLSFFFIGIVPYAIQEKKLGWWTIKRTIEYASSSGEGETFLSSFSNYVVVTLRNISLGVFGSMDTIFMVLSFVILTALVFEGILFIKKKDVFHFIPFFITIYWIFFGLLIKYPDLDIRQKWFFGAFIPLLYVYIAILLEKIYLKRKFIFFILISIYLGMNIFTYVSFVPTESAYSFKRNITKVILEDSKGRNLDIYGFNPEPYYYIMWHQEKDAMLKEQYFKWVKWAKKKDSSLIYYIAIDDRDMDAYAASLTLEQKVFGTYEKIYQDSHGWEVFRIE